MLNQLWSFINKNKYEIAYRGWNGLTAGAVAYQLYSDPIANAAEYLPDIILHGIEAIIPDKLPAPMMIGFNLLRAGQAANAFLTGQAGFPIVTPSQVQIGIIGVLPNIAMISTETTIPAAANAIDVLNHAINLHRHLKEVMSEKGSETVTKNPKTFLPTRLAKRQSANTAMDNEQHHNYDLRSRKKSATF